MDVPTNAEAGTKVSYGVNSFNTNSSPVPAKGLVKIYRLEKLKGVNRNRLFPPPDQPILSKEEFQDLFPGEPYDARFFKPELGPLVYEQEFESNGTFNGELQIPSDWDSGSYRMEVYNSEDFEYTFQAQRDFTIKRSFDRYVSNGTLFTREILNPTYATDGYADVRLRGAVPNLPILIEVNFQSTQLFYDFRRVDGPTIIRVPLNVRGEGSVRFRFSALYDNHFYTQETRLEFEKPETKLDVAVNSFRSNFKSW